MEARNTTNEHGTPCTILTLEDGSERTITPAIDLRDRETLQRYAKTADMTAGQAGDALAGLPAC